MGTAVLSPHDCLNSRFKTHIQPLVRAIYPSASPPRSKRKAMGSLVSECNRLDSSSAVNSGHAGSISSRASGLLPTPESRTNTAHLLSFNSSPAPLSSPRPMSSSVTLPYDANFDPSALPAHSLPYGSASTYHTRSYLWPSRSSSAGPILWFSHSTNRFLGVKRRYASTGRHPFRLVQGTSMTSQSALITDSNINVLQENAQHSKFSDTKSFGKGVDFDDKKLGVGGKLNGADVVSDIAKRSQGDFHTRKGSKEGEHVNLKPSKKQTDGKKGDKRQWVDQVNTRQIASAAGPKQKIGSAPSAAVTILQRPNTKEAAQELLAKFEWKGQERVSLSTQSEMISRPCSDVAVSMLTTLPEGQCVTSLASASTVIAIAPKNEANDARKVQSTRNEVLERGELESGASACKREVVLEDAPGVLFLTPLMIVNERWAGPAYTISPPPSSLPLPRFSLRQLRLCSLEMQLMENKRLSDQAGAVSAPITLAGQGVIHRPGLSPHEGRIDVAYATRDLRRILNLDSC